MKKRLDKKTVNKGGAQLLSMVIVMGLVAMLAPKGYEQFTNYMARKTYDVTSDQFNFVQSSALQYVKDNYATLAGQVAVNKPVYISQDVLKQKGYLPSSFGANANAQVYQLAVVANPAFNGQLQAFLLTSGGNAYDYGALRHISSGIKGLGGYVWDNNLASGAEGGWKIKLSDYNITNKKGTLVSFIPSDMIGTGTQDGDRLYRYAVNNRPELNRMHTDIDVNSNDLNNIKTASGQNANFSETVKGKNGQFEEAVTAKTATTQGDIKSNDGWIVTQNSKGWMNTTHGGGWYMSDDKAVRSLNNKDVYTAGQMKAGTIGLEKINVAGTPCSTSGDLSRDAAGATLSCQNGVWADNGGYSATQVFRTSTTVGFPTQCTLTNTATGACSCKSGMYSVVVSSVSATTGGNNNGSGSSTTTKRTYVCTK
ncbi:shufflon system plasmid conjugative transfer pilus tip adhesin PilV [Yersinia ruckeri]|nr:shufflon system plasmid conjugative transfer pilus tip adhesin PilV [Yersinia ruckeri]